MADASGGYVPTGPKTDWTREELVSICEEAVVPIKFWNNRDSADAQAGVGRVWALLKAGAEFTVIDQGTCATTDRTIWIELSWPGFQTFEVGSGWAEDTFYLPTPHRLAEAAGTDWY